MIYTGRFVGVVANATADPRIASRNRLVSEPYAASETELVCTERVSGFPT